MWTPAPGCCCAPTVLGAVLSVEGHGRLSGLVACGLGMGPGRGRDSGRDGYGYDDKDNYLIMEVVEGRRWSLACPAAARRPSCVHSVPVWVRLKTSGGVYETRYLPAYSHTRRALRYAEHPLQGVCIVHE